MYICTEKNTDMDKWLPEYFLEKTQLTGTVTFAVLFAIVFLNIYIPFSDTAWFQLGDSVFFLFTAGFIAISILISGFDFSCFSFLSFSITDFPSL